MRIRRAGVDARRRVTTGVAALAAAAVLAGCVGSGPDEPDPGTAGPSGEAVPVEPVDQGEDGEEKTTPARGGEASGERGGDGDDDGTTEQPAEQAAAPALPEVPSEQTVMTRVDYLTGGITPKSVVANGHGLVIANNMMYSHTSTVYDAESRELVTTLSDEVDLAELGVEGHPGLSRGAPVEAAWTADGRYAYVSQYTMYGSGFGKEGFDACTPADGVGASFLYRFDAEEMAWDQAIRVGAVPKFVALTPDQTRVLVSNWCDSTISVVDVETAEEVEVIPVAAAPRGIEVLPDNRTAYVAAMYADLLFRVDLETGESEVMMETTRKPRHLNLSEDGRWLYLAVSGADTVYKIDTGTEQVVDQVVVGREPRSMDLSSDGTALYVVNYYEPSVAKVRTSDMTVLQKEPTDATPIGVTYEPTTHSVWVAGYGGSIAVFDDTEPADEPAGAPADQAGGAPTSR